MEHPVMALLRGGRGEDVARGPEGVTPKASVVGVVVVVLVFAALLFVQAASRQLRGEDALGQLSAEERRELVTTTQRALVLGCPRDGIVSVRCVEQAELLLSLEECDSVCRDIARAFVARPTR
ncbi:MAG: hypothetical protein IPK71_16815 [Myxococcales bacterium]|jgi:hypothetical protein|nr:hypothetical protein [Myxococcales bacterium]